MLGSRRRKGKSPGSACRRIAHDSLTAKLAYRFRDRLRPAGPERQIRHLDADAAGDGPSHSILDGFYFVTNGQRRPCVESVSTIEPNIRQTARILIWLHLNQKDIHAVGGDQTRVLGHLLGKVGQVRRGMVAMEFAAVATIDGSFSSMSSD